MEDEVRTGGLDVVLDGVRIADVAALIVEASCQAKLIEKRGVGGMLQEAKSIDLCA